ncbi:MAG: hypothetical protein R3F24_11430 [Gammaproteobacteria bacterium]
MFVVVPYPDQGWAKILLATDDGIWVVNGDSGPAQRFALGGAVVTQLVANSQGTGLVGATDARYAFSMPLASPDQVQWNDQSNTTIENAPTRIGLPRIATDIHFGNGAARPAVDLDQ